MSWGSMAVPHNQPGSPRVVGVFSIIIQTRLTGELCCWSSVRGCRTLFFIIITGGLLTKTHTQQSREPEG